MSGKKLVINALETWPETRSSDRKLMLAVWFQQNNNYQDNFKKFFLNEAIMPETITRLRRKLQEDGLYPPTKEVEQARYDKFVNMKNYGSQLLDQIELNT